MSAADVNPPPMRVLVLSPTDGDADTIRSWLADAGVAAEFLSDGAAVCAAIDGGASALLTTYESLTPDACDVIGDSLSRQPRWSDLPVLVIASTGDDSCILSPRRPDESNLLVIRRPLEREALLSAVRCALRARRRQYELRDLLAEAERVVRQRDEFLAMLGHELRNPLGVISSAVQILNRVGSPAPEAAETRDMIERQASHLTRLVDDLLDVARVSSGKIALQRERVDLNEVARQCVRNCEALVAAQRHELTFAPSPQPVAVDGDPVRLEQILNNLLTNAIKYTPAGGRILLSIARETGGADAGEEVVARVRDSGMGIEPDMLERVFDTFTQADRSLDRAQGGVGMGLTLVRRLVQMHGGAVTASSAGLGRGSEFEVRLPLAAPASADAGSNGTVSAPAPAEGSDPGSRRHGGGANSPPAPRHILIVEDGPDARAALGRLLELWGHHVELAEDGTRGVERALASRPEVALIDIGLPGLNGYEVARRVRQVLGNRIRLIALTGYGQPDDHERTREAGFDQHLVKPVNPKLLSRLLADARPAEPAAPAANGAH